MNLELERIKNIISKLELTQHPEGGYFKEVYRAKGQTELVYRSDRVLRNYATSIYFLLTSEDFSAFHRIKQDEIWHFYEGSPITIHMLNEEMGYSRIQLGSLRDGLEPQFVVPANTWFASEIEVPNSYGLVGCGVAPGFDFDDFELADMAELSDLFPEYKTVVSRLVR